MKKTKKIHSRLFAAALCLVLCGLLTVGVAQARYSKQIRQGTVPFETKKSALSVTVGEWTLGDDGSYSAAITITNNSEEVIQYSVSCLSSLGSKQVTVKLDTTTAEAQAIVEGSMLSKTFGSGWIYSFLSEEVEMAWEVGAGENQNKTLTVTPQLGTSLDSAMIFQVQVERTN